jgi:hypothetical protein
VLSGVVSLRIGISSGFFFFERGHKNLASIKVGEFLDYLNECQFRKNFTPWSSLDK